MPPYAPSPNRSQARPEARAEKLSLEEKIWRSAGGMVGLRLQEATAAMGGPDTFRTQEQKSELLLRAFARQEDLIRIAPETVTTGQMTAARVALAVLEAPEAARAQHQNEQTGKSNYTQYDHNVNLLSGFNRHLAEMLTYMPRGMFADVQHRFTTMGEGLGRRYGLDTFTIAENNIQFAGLRREVAFDRALQVGMPESMAARPSTVREDRMGIDVVIAEQGEHGMTIGVDLKSQRAYTNALVKHEKFLDPLYAEDAQELGYVRMADTSRSPMPTYMLDADIFGTIDTFEYTDPKAPDVITELITGLMEDEHGHRKTLQNLGSFATKR